MVSILFISYSKYDIIALFKIIMEKSEGKVLL